MADISTPTLSETTAIHERGVVQLIGAVRVADTAQGQLVTPATSLSVSLSETVRLRERGGVQVIGAIRSSSAVLADRSPFTSASASVTDDSIRVTGSGAFLVLGTLAVRDLLTVQRVNPSGNLDATPGEHTHVADAYVPAGSEVALDTDEIVAVRDVVSAAPSLTTLTPTPALGELVRLRTAGGVTLIGSIRATDVSPARDETIRVADEAPIVQRIASSTLLAALTDTVRVAETRSVVRIPLSVAIAETLHVGDRPPVTSGLTTLVLSISLVESVRVRDVVVRPITDLTPELEISAELNGAGNGWTNLTLDVARDRGVRLMHGMPRSAPTERVGRAPTCSFDLLNNAGLRPDATTRPLGYYTLHHAQTRPGWALNVTVRVRLTDPATGFVHTRFIGRVDTVEITGWALGARRVSVTAVGWLDEAARWTLTPEIGEQVNQRANEIFSTIIATMPVQPYGLTTDLGREIYPFALDQSSTKQAAYTEFAKLAASEFGYIFEQPDGTVRFEGRHGRLLNTGVTWAITDDALLAPDTGLRVRATRDAIMNLVRVTIHPKRIDVAPTTIVYNQTNAILIPAGTTKILLGNYVDPVTGDPIGATAVQPLTAGSDYLGNALESGSGPDRTADLTIAVDIGQNGARFSVFNAASEDLWLTLLQLRGKGIYDFEAVAIEARDAGSVTTFGERTILYDMPYQWNAAIAQGTADYLLANEATDVARADTITVYGRSPALLTQLLTRQISDLVSVDNPLTGVSGQFFIHGIEWALLPSGHVQATYALERRITVTQYWLLGVSVLGTETFPVPF